MSHDLSHLDRRDRVNYALSRFVFPGCLVPRGEMAEAVLAALDHGDDFVEYLPAKTIVHTGWADAPEVPDASL